MAAMPFSSYLQSVVGHVNGNTRRIPCTHDDPSVIWGILDFIDNVGQLIDPLSGIVTVTINILRSKMSPLKPIHGSQIPHLAMLQPNTIKILSRSISVPNFDAPF